MTADNRDTREETARWRSAQFSERYFSYRGMAARQGRYDERSIVRAQKIVARYEELRTSGLDKVSALRQAEREHPVEPYGPSMRYQKGER